MKKLLICLSLILLPFSFGFGQISVSGVAGSDGYSVLRAQADVGFPLVPGLGLTGKYSYFEQDDMSAMSRFALGARYRIPFIDIVEIGAEAGWQPKANQYSNYYWDVRGAVNIEHLFYSLLPLDELKFGLGLRNTYHSFYSPDNDVTETDIYTFLTAAKGGFDATIIYTKALNYSGDKNTPPPWLDVPGFVSVYYGYLDYSIGVNAGYTYKIIRPYAAYTYLRTDNCPSADDLRLGLILNVMGVSVNGSVEWLNFSRNSGDRKALFSLSAGIKFL